jgi:hypothetical protein
VCASPNGRARLGRDPRVLRTVPPRLRPFPDCGRAFPNHLLARALLQRQAAAPAIELDIDKLLREQSHLVIEQIMPDVFLAIAHRELSTNLPSGTAKYAPGEPLRIEYSGRES